jgi:hypothetical protein
MPMVTCPTGVPLMAAVPDAVAIEPDFRGFVLTELQITQTITKFSGNPIGQAIERRASELN